MSETLNQFISFNKIMSLHFTNTLAKLLKLGLCITDFSGQLNDYQTSIEPIPEFTCLGQFTYQNRGILIAIDPKIIALSTQRCFGGSAKLIEIPETKFSYAQEFICKRLMSIFDDYLQQKKCNTHLSRIDFSRNRTHLFFPEEKIVSIALTCSADGNSAGNIHIMYPQIFLKQEKEKWLENN